jgi:voltage-gated potassium channel
VSDVPEPKHEPARDRPQRVVARLEHRTLTARRAAFIITAFTIVTAVAGGVVAWLIDRADFPTLGTGLWWSLQTVTTVGYGDVVPTDPKGRIVAAVVMLTGIAFLAVVTAAVTAALIESARRRARGDERQLRDQLTEISTRLDAIEEALRARAD